MNEYEQIGKLLIRLLEQNSFHSPSITLRRVDGNEDPGGNYTPEHFFAGFTSGELGDEEIISFSAESTILEALEDTVKQVYNSGICYKCKDDLGTYPYKGPQGQIQSFCSYCDADFLKTAGDWNPYHGD